MAHLKASAGINIPRSDFSLSSSEAMSTRLLQGEKVDSASSYPPLCKTCFMLPGRYVAWFSSPGKAEALCVSMVSAGFMQQRSDSRLSRRALT